MVRIRTAIVKRKGRKRILKQAKGQFGHRHKRYRQAKKSLIKGMVYAYRDRKVKKREFRHLWIVRLNAACREEGLSYSRFITGLKTAGIALNRKMLSELAIHSPEAFKQLVETAKAAIPATAAAVPAVS